MLSKRVNSIAPSLTLTIDAKAKALKAAGKDVIGFGAGEPDFDTPARVKAAAIEALNAGRTKYTPVDGIPELKNAIAARFRTDHGLGYGANQIAVTVGAKQAIYNLLMAAVDDGDGVLIPAPYWVSYPDMVKLCGGEPQFVPTRIEDNFHLRAATLEQSIRPNSKILILNSPSNPTGAALDADELRAIGDVALKHKLWILSDEIYEKLMYDGRRATSIASLSPQLYERTVVVNGHSKSYAMTGWRLGYMAGPEAWVRAAVKLQGQSTSNATSFAQAGGVAALQLEPADMESMRQEFERRRNRIVALLRAIPGVVCPQPEGAFYVFPRIADAIAGRFADDVAFAEALLEQENVAVVPGSGFGAPGNIRLSYATSMRDIEVGVGRIATFLQR